MTVTVLGKVFGEAAAEELAGEARRGQVSCGLSLAGGLTYTDFRGPGWGKGPGVGIGDY